MLNWSSYQTVSDSAFRQAMDLWMPVERFSSVVHPCINSRREPLLDLLTEVSG